MMDQSKLTKKMFSVKIDTIPADKDLPFPSFLYLPLNRRYIQLTQIHQSIKKERYNRLLKGLQDLWIPDEFEQAYKDFLNPKVNEADDAKEKTSVNEQTLAVDTEKTLDDESRADENVKEQGKEHAEIQTDNMAESDSSSEKNVNIDDELSKQSSIFDDEKIAEAFQGLEDNIQKNEAIINLSREALLALQKITSIEKEDRRTALLNCKKIAKEILILIADDNELYAEMLSLYEYQDELDHSIVVSSMSSMVAIAAGVENIKVLSDIAVAGLLHDLGMTGMDPILLSKPFQEYTDEEKIEYEKHIEESLQTVSETESSMSDIVLKIILQHHENFDGSGFPNSLAGNNIHPFAQILHMCDLFDELCGAKQDGIPKSPNESFQLVFGSNGIYNNQQHFDPSTVKSICSFLGI